MNESSNGPAANSVTPPPTTPPANLSDEAIERILSDFRDWLRQAPSQEPPPMPAVERVDLAALVRQFTALRQEVNLQTRASRSQLEQNAQTLEKLSEAIGHLHDDEGDDGEDDADDDIGNNTYDAVRPILKALLDVRDALALAQKQFARSRDAGAASAPPTSPPAVDLKLPAWTRWFGIESAVRAAVAPLEEWSRRHSKVDAQADSRSTIESLLVGYTMSVQRLDRALEQQGLERIACVGRAFDPEVMEVVEVVMEASRSTSEVIEEVRPGYRLSGQLFRCAQVRVARPA